MENRKLNYTFEAFETEPEVKAHIFQLVAELEPYLLPGSHVAVHFNSKATKDGVQFQITLSLTSDGARIEAKGISENVFDAATEAKNALMRKFDSIQDAVVNPLERDNEIKSIVKNKGGHISH
jgi:ribosome-associated translation inhibitor RaiA